MIKSILIVFLAFSSSLSAFDKLTLLPCKYPLLTVEKNGQVSAGNFQNLVNAYRKGEALRVGWELDFTNDGKNDVTHWVNAHFLSEFNGHIYAQLPAIQQQIPSILKGSISFPTHSQLWYGLLRSDGTLTGRYSHKNNMSKTYQVRSMWCKMAGSSPNK